MHFAELLTEEQVRRVHEASLEILEDVGVLALDLIAQVGPGGTFIDTRHTLERIRATALLPQVADRRPREQWQANGALDAHARAMRRVWDILTRDNPATFSPDVDARIRAEFEGLVSGDPRIDWSPEPAPGWLGSSN